MQDIRKNYLEQNNSLSDVGVHTVNIDVNEAISSIDLVIKGTNGSTSNTGQKLADAITKIELVNGSDVLFSLSGSQAIANAYYNTNGGVQVNENEQASGVQSIVLSILFGMFVGDKRFYLNPADYNNLQLKIQTNATISTTVGFTTGTLSTSTIVNLITGNTETNSGFVMTKSHNDFTVSASGDEITDLPTDYNYLGLMVMARETAVTPQAAITNIKLSLNSDRVIPFDILTADLVKLERIELEAFEYSVGLLLAQDGVYNHCCWNEGRLEPVAVTDSILTAPTSVTAESMVLSVIDATTPGTPADASATIMDFIGKGYNPFGCMYLPLGNIPGGGFKVVPKDSVKLKLTQGNAGGVGGVILSQLRTR